MYWIACTMLVLFILGVAIPAWVFHKNILPEGVLCASTHKDKHTDEEEHTHEEAAAETAIRYTAATMQPPGLPPPIGKIIMHTKAANEAATLARQGSRVAVIINRMADHPKPVARIVQIPRGCALTG
jgi:hypothetical protein